MSQASDDAIMQRREAHFSGDNNWRPKRAPEVDCVTPGCVGKGRDDHWTGAEFCWNCRQYGTDEGPKYAARDYWKSRGSDLARKIRKGITGR